MFLWLLSNSKIWHMVFSWKDTLTQHCVALKVMLMLWKEEEGEKEVNRGKASASPLLPSSFVISLWHLHAQIHTQQDITVCFCIAWMAVEQLRFLGFFGKKERKKKGQFSTLSVKRWGFSFGVGLVVWGFFFPSMSRAR